MRILVVALAIAALAAVSSGGGLPTLPEATLASGEIQGDVNCGGTINSIDALQVLRNAAGLSINAACMAAAGNTNCDASINSVDALRILRHAAALQNSVPQGCTPIGELIGPTEPPGPTSYELIDGALANGDIDPETALIYKTFAAFGDSRLPAQYEGDDSGVEENSVTKELGSKWGTLSQQTQDTLAPFMKTPPEADSWYSLPTVNARTTGRVQAATVVNWGQVYGGFAFKIWYDANRAGDQLVAQNFAAELDGKIWGDLTTLMQKAPKPDCGAGCPSGGGDNRLDIYLVEPSVGSSASQNPSSNGCENTAASMLLRRNAPLATLAHEFMHVLQFNFDYAAGDGCTEPDWWWEATAQWAKDYVYPSGPEGQKEQNAATDLLDVPKEPLESTATSDHEYGAYLLPFYIARKYNQPQWVQTTFEELGSHSDSLAALDQALKIHLLDGFEKIWHDFALQNWNRDPVDDYKQWDNLMPGAKTEGASPEPLSLNGNPDYPVELSPLKADGLKHLSASYYHFNFTDDTQRTVIFNNGWTEELNLEVDLGLGTRYAPKASSDPDADKVKVQALVKIGGNWTTEDWSGLDQRYFCRDKVDERVEELVLVFSNAQFTDRNKVYRPADLPPTLWTTNMGCWEWSGLATFHSKIDGVTTDIVAAVHYQQLFQGTYTIAVGPIAWTVSGTDSGGCTHSGDVSTVVDGDPTYLRYLVTFNHYTGGLLHRSYEALGYSQTQVEELISCPDPPPFYSIHDMGMWLEGESPDTFKVGAGGDQIDGVFINLSGGESRWDWHLNALRE